MPDIDVSGNVASGISSIQVQEWIGGPVLDTIKARSIVSFKVTGNSKAAVEGNLSFVSIELSGRSSVGPALGFLTVAGQLDSVLVTAPAGEISSIRTGDWTNVSVETLRVERLSVFGNIQQSTLTLEHDPAATPPQSVESFSASGRVSGFTLTAPDGIGTFSAGAIGLSGTMTEIDAGGARIGEFTIKGIAARLSRSTTARRCWPTASRNSPSAM